MSHLWQVCGSTAQLVVAGDKVMSGDEGDLCREGVYDTVLGCLVLWVYLICR